MLTILTAIAVLGDTVVLDNAWVRVTRDGARCAAAATAGCADRVIVATGDITLRAKGAVRRMRRGDIAVFEPSESYEAPTGAGWFEVAFKPNHPPVQAPKETIRPDKNAVLFENARIFLFEERLAVGDTRPRHSHNPRVVIQLNRTRLQQWPDGEPELLRDIEPDRPGWNPSVIHVVKNVGALPLRGIVIELKP